MRQYITSDWHLFHRNIMGESGFVETRKHFDYVEEMNATIIKAINRVVTNDDEVYHLGDISMNAKPHKVFEVLTQIKGQLHLVKGNHDDSKVLNYLKKHNYLLPNGKDKFVIYEVGTIIKREGIQYYLTHYPLVIGAKRARMRSICGHIHENHAEDPNCLNVGIDSPELPKDHPFGEPLEITVAMALVNTKWVNHNEL